MLKCLFPCLKGRRRCLFFASLECGCHRLWGLPSRFDVSHNGCLAGRALLVPQGVSSTAILRLFYPALLSSFAFSFPPEQPSLLHRRGSSPLLSPPDSASLSPAEGIIPAEQLKPVALVITTLRVFPDTDRLSREQKLALCKAALSSLAVYTSRCFPSLTISPHSLHSSSSPASSLAFAQNGRTWQHEPIRSNTRSTEDSQEKRATSLATTLKPKAHQGRDLQPQLSFSRPGPLRSALDYAHMVEAALVGAAELRVNEPGERQDSCSRTTQPLGRFTIRVSSVFTDER